MQVQRPIARNYCLSAEVHSFIDEVAFEKWAEKGRGNKYTHPAVCVPFDNIVTRCLAAKLLCAEAIVFARQLVDAEELLKDVIIICGTPVVAVHRAAIGRLLRRGGRNNSAKGDKEEAVACHDVTQQCGSLAQAF